MSSSMCLDDFLPNVVTGDTHKRTQVHSSLVSYLSDPRSSLASDDIGEFIAGLTSWVSSSNHKISINGLEVLCILVDRMGEDFRQHVASVLPAVVDRLGDAKDQVRSQAQQLILKLMMPASSPQYVYERMMGTFTHKLWHVRDEICICLQNAINRYGARCLQLSKIVPNVCKLLEDQNGQVRENAIVTLVEIYRHVGERVRMDLTKKNIPTSRLNQIFAKFDEVKTSGNMVATADLAPSRSDSRGSDDTDFAKPSTSKVLQARKAPSAPIGRKTLFSGKATGGSSAAAGALDEDLFIKSFEDVPHIQMFSARDLQDHVTKIKDTLSDPNIDWEKRVDSLRAFRGLLITGAADYDEFSSLLRILEPSFVLAAKDLRSQVVRETCITIAYMSQQLGSKMDHFAECVFPAIVALIPNGAKVMATSGTVCIRFIIQYTHSHRLIPIITSNMASKSVSIRKTCCEFLNQLLHTWPTHILDRHIAILQESIKRGIGDADSDVRALSRKAFWGFAEHFKDQADAMLNSLDASKQKLLQGELSTSSSNNSINGSDSLKIQGKIKPRSVSSDRGSSDTLGRVRRSVIPKVSTQTTGTTAVEYDDHDLGLTERSHTSLAGAIKRSSSAVDLGGATVTTSSKPLSSTMQAAARMSKGSTHSLPRKKSGSVSSNSNATSSLSAERSRPRSRIGVSQSQPSSRSGSPSSRLSYITHNTAPRPDPLTPSSRPRRSGIPRSQGASREGSPSRQTYNHERRLSGSRIATTSHGKPQVMAQRVLRHGSDVEDALHDALVNSPRNKTSSRSPFMQKMSIRKRYESYDSDDNASETSSVCSERSFSSYSGRTSEASSDIDRWYRRMSTPTKAKDDDSPGAITPQNEKDINEIFGNMTSGSYADRKDGLISLQRLLKLNRTLNRAELRKVTEIFTRMFHDPHSKVFSLFLDTLVDLIAIHRSELQDWLFVMLTRLLNKMGSDMLGSVQAKLQKALDSIRDSFPCDHQFNILTRYTIDQTQSPNLKVKIALLNYMHGLIVSMEPSDFVNSSDTRLAVSRIITWTTEPKSVDVRRSAQAVLIALFNLNAPEFSMMLSLLPKTFQDGATKILHNHLRTAGHEMEVLSPRNVSTPPMSRHRRTSRSGAQDEYETENMNPEDIYKSIKQTSADIQKLSYNSKLDHYGEGGKHKDFPSQDSGIQEIRNDSPDTADGRKNHYNPSQYQDESTLNGYNRAALAEAVFDVENDLFNEDAWKSLLGLEGDGLPVDQSDMIAEILTELSNHNERNEERKNAMLSLMKFTRGGTFTLWDEHFKSILLILLETLGDNDGHIRALALRVLREILRNQPQRFKDYAELTILRIIEAHKDPVKEVMRSAEECASTLASSIPPDASLRILDQIIHTSTHPINLAAIKMQTKVVELSSADLLQKMLPAIAEGLVKGCSDPESSVRKAAVFCLVSIFLVVGEPLRAHLTDLNGGKMKLLNLYIKRAQALKSGLPYTSPTSDI